MILFSSDTWESFHRVKEKGITGENISKAMRERPEDWVRLFEFYNQFNEKVNMNCRPCYYKVFKFVDAEVKKYFKPPSTFFKWLMNH